LDRGPVTRDANGLTARAGRSRNARALRTRRGADDDREQRREDQERMPDEPGHGNAHGHSSSDGALAPACSVKWVASSIVLLARDIGASRKDGKASVTEPVSFPSFRSALDLLGFPNCAFPISMQADVRRACSSSVAKSRVGLPAG